MLQEKRLVAGTQRVAGMLGKTRPKWIPLLYFTRGALPPGCCETHLQNLTHSQQVSKTNYPSRC